MFLITNLIRVIAAIKMGRCCFAGALRLFLVSVFLFQLFLKSSAYLKLPSQPTLSGKQLHSRILLPHPTVRGPTFSSPSKLSKRTTFGAFTANLHDNVTYRVRSGEILYIPQAERYSTKDWLHNLKTLPSSYLLKRISSVVLFNVIWSIFIAVTHHFTKFKSPGSRTHSLLGSALGLLLVFRTNTAYNRFWEGRKIWEKLLSGLRSTASMIVSILPRLFQTSCK